MFVIQKKRKGINYFVHLFNLPKEKTARESEGVNMFSLKVHFLLLYPEIN